MKLFRLQNRVNATCIFNHLEHFFDTFKLLSTYYVCQKNTFSVSREDQMKEKWVSY